MVNENTGDIGDAFRFRCKHTSVSGDDAVVTVDDDGIDKAELPEGRAEFRDLLRRMRPGIVGVGYELADGDKLHIRGGFSQDLHLLKINIANRNNLFFGRIVK